MDASRRIDEALLTLAWSLWTELGVAGVERHHQRCAVDPEALLLFTATLVNRDRRLLDESLDCALAIAPYLFVSRLKGLLRTATPAVQQSFAPLAAAFNGRTKTYVRLPTTADASPHRASPSGKSERGALGRPSQVILRCRSIFGVAARADVVAAMLCVRQVGWTASELAWRVSLSKRVVASALQDLERGGLLRATAVGNRLRYGLVAREPLQAVVGAMPTSLPLWTSILPFMAAVASLVEHAPARNETALLVDAQKLVTELQTRLGRLAEPFTAPPFGSWRDVAGWLADELELVAAGQSPWLAEQSVRPRSP